MIFISRCSETFLAELKRGGVLKFSLKSCMNCKNSTFSVNVRRNVHGNADERRNL